MSGDDGACTKKEGGNRESVAHQNLPLPRSRSPRITFQYPHASSRGKGASLTAGPYSSGARASYAQRYQADLERLWQRSDLPADSHWVDSHCHLESILARTWRGGGKPQVMHNEPRVSLVELVELWPQGLDACICNCAFRMKYKGIHAHKPPEWTWLEQNLWQFEDGLASNKVWFTIGIHPHDAGNWDAVAEQTVRRLAGHPKCVGIGECGLDFFKHDERDRAGFELQVRTFRAQAKLAVELGKALVIHARLVTIDNEEICFRELSEQVPHEHPIHMHAFSDSLDFAQKLCNRWPKLRIGFTGAITFRGNPQAKGKGKGGVVEKKGEDHCRALVTGLPLDRILIETDGPYMCPEPFRGQTAHPGHVHRVAEKIAEWQRQPLGEVMAATRKSTYAVYGV